MNEINNNPPEDFFKVETRASPVIYEQNPALSSDPNLIPNSTPKKSLFWIFGVAILVVLGLGIASTFGYYAYKYYQKIYPIAFLPIIADLKPDVPLPEGSIAGNTENKVSELVENPEPASSTGQSGQTSTGTASKKSTSTKSGASSAGTGNSDSGSASDSVSTSSQSSSKTINNNGIKLATKSQGHCRALAPESWALACNQEATGADLYTSDNSAHSGWSISYIYRHMFKSVEDYLNFGMPTFVGFNGFRLTSGEQDWQEGFKKRDFESDGKKGLVFYKTYDTGDGNYIVSSYFASSDSSRWDGELGATAQSAAISLRCSTQLRPGTSGTDPSSKNSNSEVSLSDKWTEAIMGYENVYDTDTGDHYQASTSSYWETGPSGPGYYKQSGNDYKKLERGFGNY